MPAFTLHATDSSGEDASFEGHGTTFEDAYARAEEDLAGTAVRLDPLPTTCPVRIALRKVRRAADGVRGASALWQAQDELIRAERFPYTGWLHEREKRARDLADDLQALSNAAIEALTVVAGQLRTRDQLELSVAHENRETFRAAIAKATL